MHIIAAKQPVVGLHVSPGSHSASIAVWVHIALALQLSMVQATESSQSAADTQPVPRTQPIVSSHDGSAGSVQSSSSAM